MDIKFNKDKAFRIVINGEYYLRLFRYIYLKLYLTEIILIYA